MANEGDIHFPPGQRRDKPKFEPPPWERDQFEELAKRKQEIEPESPQASDGVPPFEEPREKVNPDAPPSVEQTVVVTNDEGEPETATQVAEKPGLDPKRMELLMLELRSEEPQLQGTYWKISAASGALSALIGIVVTMWGLVSLVTVRRGSTAPGFMAAVLVVFGIGFIAIGVWVIFRTLRQQGVL
jgi:hypothetical protein